MRHCPTCNRSYTDDTLSFCLEDGAPLLAAGSSSPTPPTSFDPQATLRISSSESSNHPTEVLDQRASATIGRQAPPQPTMPVQPPRMTSAPQDAYEPQPSFMPSMPAAATAPAAQKPSNPLMVAGVTAIAVLLLVLVGIGIAMLVRDNGGDSNAKTAESSNTATNRKEDGNKSSPEANANDRAAKSNTNDGNKNTSPAQSAMARAEAKVVNGTPITENDLKELSIDELARLRNTVYARHGRTFNRPELQRYFDSRPWYRPSYNYSDSALTQTDRANINLIQAVESSR